MYGMGDATSAGEAYGETARLIRKEIKKEKKVLSMLTEHNENYWTLLGRIEGLKQSLKCIKQAIDNVGEG